MNLSGSHLFQFFLVIFENRPGVSLETQDFLILEQPVRGLFSPPPPRKPFSGIELPDTVFHGANPFFVFLYENTATKKNVLANKFPPRPINQSTFRESQMPDRFPEFVLIERP